MAPFETMLHEPLPADAWLNSKEAASRARLSLDNFLVRVRRGAGPASNGEHKLRRFRVRDVDAWVANGFKPVPSNG